MPVDESFRGGDAEVQNKARFLDLNSSQMNSSIHTNTTYTKTVVLRRELSKGKNLRRLNLRWESFLLLVSITVISFKIYFANLFAESLKSVFLKYDSVLLLSRIMRPFGTYYRDYLKQDVCAFVPYTLEMRERLNNGSVDVQNYYNTRARKLFAFTANNYSLVTAPLQITLKDYPDDLTMCKLALTKSERLPHRLLFITPIT
jgi:hypothetical protein